MRKMWMVACFVPFAAWGDIVSDAMQQVESASVLCSGIAEQISSVSGVATADTVVTAVGAVAGTGSLIAGLQKAFQDNMLDQMMQRMCDAGGCTPEGLWVMSKETFADTVLRTFAEMKTVADEVKKAQQRSVSLGNWRTGLLATNTATNVVSSIVSGLNKDQSDLIQHVSACNMAIKNLQNVRQDLQRAGISPMENPVVRKVDDMIDWCGNINLSDVNNVEKQMTAVMGIGIGGAVVGAVGTGVSGAANSKKVRNDNTVSGQKKERDLNTAANVLAGVGTASSIAGMGVNISVLSLAKRLINQAERCEEVLQ